MSEEETPSTPTTTRSESSSSMSSFFSSVSVFMNKAADTVKETAITVADVTKKTAINVADATTQKYQELSAPPKQVLCLSCKSYYFYQPFQSINQINMN